VVVGPNGTLEDSSDNSVTATADLRAEWRIASRDPDAIALVGESLREKLIAANLFGPPCINQAAIYPTPSLSPILSPYPPLALPFNAASFRLFYVGTAGVAERKTAMAAAFARAKNRGIELAEAAGCSLGRISNASRDVNGDTVQVISSEVPNLSYSRTTDTESTSPTPDLPEIVIRLSVNYTIVHP
jgi:hypothetical protein